MSWYWEKWYYHMEASPHIILVLLCKLSTDDINFMFAIFVVVVPSFPSTQLDAFLSGMGSPGRLPSSVPPSPSVPGIPQSPANVSF